MSFDIALLPIISMIFTIWYTRRKDPLYNKQVYCLSSRYFNRSSVLNKEQIEVNINVTKNCIQEVCTKACHFDVIVLDFASLNEACVFEDLVHSLGKFPLIIFYEGRSDQLNPRELNKKCSNCTLVNFSGRLYNDVVNTLRNTTKLP